MARTWKAAVLMDLIFVLQGQTPSVRMNTDEADEALAARA